MIRRKDRRDYGVPHLIVPRRVHLKGPVIDSDAPHPYVLLIDDSQEILDLLRELLGDDGYRVLVSRETTDLPRLRDLLPDVIVDEILVSGRPEAGWQFLTLTQRDQTPPHISLVLCTTTAETVREATVAEDLELLGVQVLYRPFLIGELLEMIAIMLAGARLTN